jgi:N-acetylmuramoyl-L-alanine amidase
MTRNRKPVTIGLALVVMSATAAVAQPLRIEAAGRTETVAPLAANLRHYPHDALVRIGARIEPAGLAFRAVLHQDTLFFWTGSPFFTAARTVHQLVTPVAATRDGFALPLQFFAEWLPARWPERFAYRDGVLHMAGVFAAAEPPPVAPPPNRVVIIDPGHGGNDSGKIGPNRLREKDVTLALSKTLATLLGERGYEVHLTRATDTLIALDDRPAIANRLGKGRPSAVFVSIHMNATTSSAVRGYETFFLSQARTEDERRVAEMENAAVQFEDGGERGALTEEELILRGLRNDFYVRASSDLADAVQQALGTVHDGPDRGVKRAGFRVLVGALMPAVLVEVGFISNTREARVLGDAAFQKRAALAIADAVHRFFDEHEHLWSGGGS